HEGKHERQEHDLSVVPPGPVTDGHPTPPYWSTAATCAAETRTESGTTSRTNEGTNGSGTSTCTWVATVLPGSRHGELWHETVSASSASAPSKPWSSRATRTDATAAVTPLL